MNMDIPSWLTVAAWIYVTAAVASAVVMAASTSRDPSVSPAGRFLWVLGALYMGPLAILLRRKVHKTGEAGTTTSAGDTSEQGVTSGLVHTLPGGGAAAVAHVIGVPVVLFLGLELFGLALYALIATIATIAVALILVWELAITRTGNRAVLGALTAAVLTVLAFDIGMGGWMLFLHFGWIMPPATDITFIFLMQVGLLLGCLTALPIAARLAARTSVGSREVAV